MQDPQSPTRTEDIPTGAEERLTPLQTIVEEMSAASTEEMVQQEHIVEVERHSHRPDGSVHFTDTKTVPLAKTEEIAKSDAITDKNYSTSSP